jgi:hypothetical protein
MEFNLLNNGQLYNYIFQKAIIKINIKKIFLHIKTIIYLKLKNIQNRTFCNINQVCF